MVMQSLILTLVICLPKQTLESLREAGMMDAWPLHSLEVRGFVFFDVTIAR
jgi:hypothetical protein